MKESDFECEICKNKGWIRTTVFDSYVINDGTEVIEKCDDCSTFSNDREAAKAAYDSENVLTFRNNLGFNVLLNFSEN